MECIGGQWFFCDNGQSVKKTWEQRPCGHCGLHNTDEGHDGCLGTLPDVMNACCGHGVDKDAYIQYSDGRRIGGKRAIELMNE